jgi:hypothetical protein
MSQDLDYRSVSLFETGIDEISSKHHFFQQQDFISTEKVECFRTSQGALLRDSRPAIVLEGIVRLQLLHD